MGFSRFSVGGPGKPESLLIWHSSEQAEQALAELQGVIFWQDDKDWVVASDTDRSRLGR
jgi:hypothetical protein